MYYNGLCNDRGDKGCIAAAMYRQGQNLGYVMPSIVTEGEKGHVSTWEGLGTGF